MTAGICNMAGVQQTLLPFQVSLVLYHEGMVMLVLCYDGMVRVVWSHEEVS